MSDARQPVSDLRALAEELADVLVERGLFVQPPLGSSRVLDAAITAGAVLRERTGRRQRPLGPASIRKLIDCLAGILDEAVEDGYVDRNPARGRRMRVKVPKPVRTFLEMGELVALTDAAGKQDTRLTARTVHRSSADASTASRVAASWNRGMRPSDIAADLGLSKATVSYHLRRLGADGPTAYASRRAVVAMLGGSGVRVSELCDLRSETCGFTPRREHTPRRPDEPPARGGDRW